MPAPPQVTLELARQLYDAGRQFKVCLTHTAYSPWSLFWHPDRPLEIFTHAGTSSMSVPLDVGFEKLRKRLRSGWKYAPWTLSDSKGLLGDGHDVDLILHALPETGSEPYNLVRHMVWIDLDVVEARGENDDLILTLTELGARVLSGRLSITPGLCHPRITPNPR